MNLVRGAYRQRGRSGELAYARVKRTVTPHISQEPKQAAIILGKLGFWLVALTGGNIEVEQAPRRLEAGAANPQW